VSHPERIVPDETEPGIVAIHLKRYEFARPLCAGKDVLDAACGVGYGTAYLAERARRAVGVDVEAGAIEYARERYAAENVEFVQRDLAELDLADASFDVVCSFETIEHLAQPEAFLAHAARVLRPDGAFVVSTPRVDETTSSPENPFHTVELSRADFEALLSRFFGAVELYGQHRIQTRRHRLLQRADVLGLRKRLPFVRRASRVVAGTAAMDEVSADEIEISRDGIEHASELVAVCRP
jgi:2-polyprenyl-3-methyl-5-hydroxy-6-metoxy-1,4-benzoquinol methylase